MPVTVQTPLHLQRCHLPSQGHQIHSSMAGGATDALVHVDAVVKVDKIGKIVNSRPLKGHSGPPTLPDRFEIGAVGENLRMTIHTSLGRGNAGKSGDLHRSMTVAAVNPFITNVMFVTELNWLFPRHVGLGNVGRAIHLGHYPKQTGNDEKGAKDRDPGDGIGAGMKDLRHFISFSVGIRLTSALPQTGQRTLNRGSDDFGSLRTCGVHDQIS